MIDNKDFFIIDTYFHIYRSFFSIKKELSVVLNDKRFCTNAIFGFLRFIIFLNKKYNPKYGVFVFDSGKSKDRIKLLPQYKSNRPPMPEELYDQIEPIKNIIKYFGWKLIEKNEYEADDIIATLTNNFNNNVNIKIFSNDKDLFQLINNNTSVFITSNTKSDDFFKKQNLEDFKNKYEIFPIQIIDLLALTGDIADNINGVNGIGPKIATKLIKEYHSIENIFNNLEHINDLNIQKKLKDNKNIIFRNKKIITLNKSVDDIVYDKDINNFEIKSTNFNEIHSLCNLYKLNKITKQINNFNLSNNLIQKYLF